MSTSIYQVMSKRLYALVFTDSSIPMDFTIYESFQEALTKYIEYSLHETRRMLISTSENEDADEDTNEVIDSEEDELSCSFQVLERCDPSTEYILIKEYGMEYFLEDFIGNREDVETYLDELEKVIHDETISLPQEVMNAFTPY